MTTINPIRPELGQGLPLGDRPTQTLSATVQPPQSENVFEKAINEVNQIQMQAGALQQSMYAGDPVELHRVMIAAEEAGTAFDLMVEMRNRLIEAYQELMRMQI